MQHSDILTRQWAVKDAHQNWERGRARHAQTSVGGVEVDVGYDGLAALGLPPDEDPDEVVEDEGGEADTEAKAGIANVSQEQRHCWPGQNRALKDWVV